MGRNAKPIKLQLIQGNPNRLTKAEIEERKKAEIKIGINKLNPPDFIKDDAIAHSKWKELIKIYDCPDGENFITSADIDILAMYCQTFSEARTLIGLRAKAKTDKGKIKYTTALLKTRDLQIKLSNILYLNPPSRAKNVPKRKLKPEESPLQKAGFGYI